MTTIQIEQLLVGPMLNFSYVLADADAGVCAAVDPGWDARAIVETATKRGWRIDKILLTHAHFDHANALADLAMDTQATVYVHREERGDIGPGYPIETTEDGTEIALGGLSIACLHTPGHTSGSQCFLADGNIFTGDTLFIDGCGRVDLPGSNPRDMVHSLKRLAKLPPETKVWPGHDYGGMTSTIGELVRTNPYLTNRE